MAQSDVVPAEENGAHSLLQSEEHFRLLVESVKDYAIFMLDPRGYITTWNVGANRIKGYTAAEIIGQHFSRFYQAADIERQWPQRELELAIEQGRFEDEGWRVRKDGSTFWANVIITPLYDKQQNLYAFAKITRDLTERGKIESLQRNRRQMDEFLAMLAHELRNPLAPIQNAVGVIRMKMPDDATLKWGIDIIERQARHLTRLVDDLLDASRITTGKIALQKVPLDLVAVAASAADASRSTIATRNIQLKLALPPSPVRIEGDPTRLTQVIMNLLNNAANYTPMGGEIRLSVEIDVQEAVIRVRDTGIGIPPAMQEKIFEIFVQGDRKLDRADGGLGIGLTLVKQLVSLHGGTVSVSSEGAGRGSEFVVRLPIARERGDATPASATITLPRPTGSAAAPSEAQARILVVDDNVDSAESMRIMLNYWGYDARTAYNGLDALALAARYRPHLVLLDLGLPNISGHEVAARLREQPGMEQLPCIAITGYGQPQDRERTRKAGFAHHLLKPVDADALQALLVNMIGPAS